MTNKEILENYDNLLKIKENTKLQLPIQVTYAVTRNIRVLKSIVEDIINTKMKLLQEHGKQVEDNPGYFVPIEGHEQILTQSLSELDNVECNVDIMKVNLNTLFHGLDTISVADMDSLYFMLDEG